MIRTLLAGTLALAVLTMASHAAANDVLIQQCYAGTCTYTWGKAPEMSGTAKILRVPEPATDEERAAFAERDREWQHICQPVLVLDRYGMTRYTYGPYCPNGVPVGDGRRP